MIYTKETLEPRHLYYYPDDFDAWDMTMLQKAFDELDNQKIQSPRELLSLLYQLAELMSVLSQEINNLYYDTLKNTSDINARDRLTKFTMGPYQYAEKRNHSLITKYYEHPMRKELNQDFFKQINLTFEYLFGVQAQYGSDLRERELTLISQYRDRINQLQFDFQGELHFFKDSAKLFENPDPMQRISLWNARKDAFIKVKSELFDVYCQIVSLRKDQAKAAGLTHYYEVDHRSGINNSYDFAHFKEILASLKKHLPPILQKIHKQWTKSLKLSKSGPWDWEVNPDTATLKPFSSVQELISKSIRILYDLRFEYGLLLNKMWNTGLMDLEYNEEKAAGQFYFSSFTYSTCKVMMNCRGSHDNMMMFFHEMGHVLQTSALMKNPLHFYIAQPLEIREIASQALVYLSMAMWEDFYPDPQMLQKAIRYQYSQDLINLAKSACRAELELEIYESAELSPKEMEAKYLQIFRAYFPEISSQDCDEYLCADWLMQVGVFEFPFYDINTTLSLFPVWQLSKSYAKDRDETIMRFQNFLSKSSELNIHQLYEVLGIKCDHSDAHIKKILELAGKQALF